MERVDSYLKVFEKVFHHTIDILLIVDQNRHTLFSTPNLNEISGYSPEELRMMDIFDIVHPEDREYMLQRHHHILSTEQKSTTEYRIINKWGEVRFFECKTTPLPDTENYLQVISVRDVTDRVQMERELQLQKNQYKLLQNSLKKFSMDLHAVMNAADLKDRLIKELKTILPAAEPELFTIYLKETSDELLDAEALTRVGTGGMISVLDRIWINIGKRKDQLYILSINAIAIDEEMYSMWLETLVYYTAMVFGNLNVVDVLMDQLEEALIGSETPQWVLRLLFNLHEQQRLALSSDLHDSLLQDQIDLYRRLESLISQTEMGKESKAGLIEIEQGMLDTIHLIRETCNELRPPLLRELGLERALENLFDHVQLTSTYKVIFTTGNQQLPSLTEEETIAIYRIIQELLYHADKHSNASILTFHLDCKESELMLMYSDNRAELDASQLHAPLQQTGLTSIIQRTRSMGGVVKFVSNPKSGLEAVLKLPIISGRNEG